MILLVLARWGCRTGKPESSAVDRIIAQEYDELKDDVEARLEDGKWHRFVIYKHKVSGNVVCYTNIGDPTGSGAFDQLCGAYHGLDGNYYVYMACGCVCAPRSCPSRVVIVR